MVSAIRAKGLHGLWHPVWMTVCLLVLPASALMGQTASVSGRVVDPFGAVVRDAEVTLTRKNADTTRRAATNAEGLYILPFVQPGVYNLSVAASGFKTFVQSDITIETGQNATIEVRLEVGAQNELITVDGGGINLGNATDGSVSTRVDRRFVENLPMNGRSLQTLIGLTPGVVYTTSAVLEQGQFSINGQRSNTNYFVVDGVSANFGISPTTELGQTGSGSIPALGASGGTNTLVSVDAIQEFRIQTSTFAPEYGRQPGGQISMATRPGTNGFHGSLLWYFRNDKLDANDWFANRDGLEKPKLRQNDVAATLGGPVVRDRTFFFFAYETLRLRTPRVVVQPVPSAAVRVATPEPLQPYINAYPVANGPALANGFATFSAGYSDRSNLDATSIRLDHQLGSAWNVFGRYNHAPSNALQRATNQNAANVLTSTWVDTDTLTAGLAGAFGRMVNDSRFNYSRARAASASEMDALGNAAPLSKAAMFPSFTNRGDALFQFLIQGSRNLFSGTETTNIQQQYNFTDHLSVAAGNHQLKFGVDYRALLPTVEPRGYQQSVQFANLSANRGGVLSGAPAAVLVLSARRAALRYTNLSLYAQDTWRASRRISITYGLRWEYNPPPSGRDGTEFSTFRDASGSYRDISTLGIVTDQPVYHATYVNVAPRIGIAYQLSQRPGRETVLRDGYGLYYDHGTGSYNPSLNPLPGSMQLAPLQYPLPESAITPPPPSLNPPFGTVAAADPDLKLPRIHQFSAAVEQSLGAGQVLSATYVGAVGRKLLALSGFATRALISRTFALRRIRPRPTTMRCRCSSRAAWRVVCRRLPPIRGRAPSIQSPAISSPALPRPFSALTPGRIAAIPTSISVSPSPAR